jgi:enamine deaminase RidA (YjgF/YER057c/UK114 family)
MFCNEQQDDIISVTVYLDDSPDTDDALNNFKDYLVV